MHGAYAILWGCNASLPGCAPPGRAVMGTGGNTIYQEPGRPCTALSGCDVACGMGGGNSTMLSIADFERLCGGAQGTTDVRPVPPPAELEAMARAVLVLPHGYEAS